MTHATDHYAGQARFAPATRPRVRPVAPPILVQQFEEERARRRVPEADGINPFETWAPSLGTGTSGGHNERTSADPA